MKKSRYTLPLLPLRGITVFPGTVVHFDVGRAQSIAAVKQAMNGDKLIFLCYQNDINIENPELDDLAEIGTISEVQQILNLPDGNIRILAEGICRGKITRFSPQDDYVSVNVSRKDDILCDDTIASQALMRKTLHIIEKFMELYDRFTPEMTASLLSIDEPGELADVIVANFPIKPQLKQLVLDKLDVLERLEKLNEILLDEIQVLSLEKNIMNKVHSNMDKSQHDYMLREKLNVIRRELGEDDETETEVKKYTERLKDKILPAEVKAKLDEEFERLRRTAPVSQEYAVIQNYIETVVDLPWGIKTDEQYDIKPAAKILDRDHFGLEKVKERILEYIAVRYLGGNPKSNIICLVGPPGTGKTSIAHSLAEALGRKYIRISLGGVKSESEIRGHRKTYIGAMPGRIIDALKRVNSSNPLMLFDEIDKMSADMTGDPAAALLEALDPEQNKSFRDHFLELPFDLSDVLFVTTANSLDTVSRPLLDRMDVIEIGSYTTEEKINIAKKYLVPKQLKYHGLTKEQLKFASSSYLAIIDGYTREAGVRELERKISALCRKTAVKLAEDPSSIVSVRANNVKDFLGKPSFSREKADKSDKIGVVTGLAWTTAGGDTLSVEVTTMPGTGKTEITGNIGDVMNESARAALSYVRSNAFTLGINKDFYKNTDIHIHIPEGAVPKDGPSAGITMATALISALSGKKVRHEVAMTGEITLRGRVLPIGGLKEKALAAFRGGITKVIIPYENKADYEELPDAVKNNISFVFAKDMDTVVSSALLPETKIKTSVSVNRDSYIEGSAEQTICSAGRNLRR